MDVGLSLDDEYFFRLSRQQAQQLIGISVDTDIDYAPDILEDIALVAIRRWAAEIAGSGQPEIIEVLEMSVAFATGRDWPRAISAVLLRFAELTSIEDGLEQADTIWPDGLPFAAAAAFAEHLPDDGMLDALEDAPDAVTRAVAIAIYLRTAPLQQRARGQSALAAAIRDWQAYDLPRDESNRLTSLLLATDVLTPALRLGLVRHELDQTRSRQELLEVAARHLPAILDIGGPGTAQTLAAAVRDISERWP